MDGATRLHFAVSVRCYRREPVSRCIDDRRGSQQLSSGGRCVDRMVRMTRIEGLQIVQGFPKAHPISSRCIETCGAVKAVPSCSV